MTKIPSPSRSLVQSVQRAGLVLGALSDSPAPLTVVELARALALDRTVVHRLVRTLVDQDFVEDLGAGRYQVGPGLLSLGNAYLDRMAIRRAALPFAIDLQNRALLGRPWVVAVAVPVRAEAILVDRIWTPQTPLNSILDVGTRLPIDRSANGRCMLAYRSYQEVAELLGAERAAELRPVLDAIRGAGGVETSSNERRPGVSAMAAVICNRSDRAVAALAISGPDLEGELSRTSELAQQLQRAAASIGAMLP